MLILPFIDIHILYLLTKYSENIFTLESRYLLYMAIASESRFQTILIN